MVWSYLGAIIRLKCLENKMDFVNASLLWHKLSKPNVQFWPSLFSSFGRDNWSKMHQLNMPSSFSVPELSYRHTGNPALGTNFYRDTSNHFRTRRPQDATRFFGFCLCGWIKDTFTWWIARQDTLFLHLLTWHKTGPWIMWTQYTPPSDQSHW